MPGLDPRRPAGAASWRSSAPAFAGSSAAIASPAIATDLRETPIHLPSKPAHLRAIAIDTRAIAADIQEIAINIHANPADIREIALAGSEFATDIRASATDSQEITPARRAIATRSPRATASSPENNHQHPRGSNFEAWLGGTRFHLSPQSTFSPVKGAWRPSRPFPSVPNSFPATSILNFVTRRKWPRSSANTAGVRS